jgi:hypothetical protein
MNSRDFSGAEREKNSSGEKPTLTREKPPTTAAKLLGYCVD